MGLRTELSGFGKRIVEELQIAAGQPEPKSVDQYTQSVRSNRVEQHSLDRKKLERYWELYKEVPIIRNPIRSFASEVVGPGYYVDAEDEDLKEDLEDWLSESAIVDGEIDKDFRHLLKKAVIQREVKGTAMAEKVIDENGNLYGFKLMRPETVRAFTYPGQSVLLAPDADINEENENSWYTSNSVYRTEDGQDAAYVQLTTDINRFDHDKNGYIPFTRDRVLKLTRDSDAGEIFGESRLTAVEDRLESLMKKLEDNDKAIESTAHPYMLFKAGTEDSPWEPEKVAALAKEHEQDRYQPGLKQFVQGDVSVDEYSGEVSDIESFLDFDLNWIISEMPMPKYSLGAFDQDVNQFISRSQSARLERGLKEARHEIEDEMTPVLREKAEELDYSPDDVNGLVIGDDPEELGLMDQNVPEGEEGNIPSGNNTDGEKNEGPAGEDFTRPPASTESDRQDEDE